MRITRVAGLTAVAALAAALAACGGSVHTSSSSPGSKTGGQAPSASGTSGSRLVVETPAPKGEAGSITWAVYRETNSLDPIYAFDYPENAAITTMCESLLRQAPDGTIGPGLATDVSIPDPLTYKITLRQGVTFWDGSPLTSDDVVYSLERARDPKLGGFYSQVFSRVKSIAATSPAEVTITLSQPDYWLRGELSSMSGVIVEKKFAEAKGKDFGTVKAGTMCTGPFKFSSWKTGQGVTVVRNDSYWDKAHMPKVGQITIIGAPDDATITSGLQTGEIDGMYPQTLSTLEELRASSDVHVYEGPSFASHAFIVSSFSGPLGDVRVRKALSLALDRAGVIKAEFDGAGQLPRTLANPGTWGYAHDVFQKAWDELPEPTVDLDTARKLVQDAGATGKTIRIGTSQQISGLNIDASAFKSAAESIGLQATLVSVSPENYINFFIDPKARAEVNGFFTINYPDYADPAALYATLVLKDGSQNYSGYENAEVTKDLEAARAEADDTQRAQDVVAAQKIIADELPWIPITDPYTVLIMNRGITGAPASFQYMFGPWAASIGAAG
jgi:peptide/nickel transport system substrate-binding protein